MYCSDHTLLAPSEERKQSDRRENPVNRFICETLERGDVDLGEQHRATVLPGSTAFVCQSARLDGLCVAQYVRIYVPSKDRRNGR